MRDLILPLGYEDIPDAFAEWITDMANWAWFVTLTFRDITSTSVTLKPQSTRFLSGIPINGPKNIRPGIRLGDSTGTNWDKPGIAYANKAWCEFLEVSKGYVHKDRRKWVRVLEIQKGRGVPHVHALITKQAEGLMAPPGPVEMKEWAFKRYGIARVLAYDPNLGAAGYIGKYLLKDERNGRGALDIDFGGFKNV
jgi:hypothetical protein